MTNQFAETPLPWYRHRWLWILMAGPAVVVVAGLITAYLAASSNDGLVDDDYYKQGLAVNKIAARDQKALALGLQADLMQSAEGAQIRVLLQGRGDFAPPALLTLRFVHPTRGGADQTLQLRAAGAGAYSAQLAERLSGRWHVTLEDEAGQWRLTGEWLVEQAATLHLPSDGAAQRK